MTVERVPAEGGGEIGYEPEAWVGDAVVGYRLITKDDFQSPTSNSLWGNVAHGAEICLHILPIGNETTGAYRAVMRPDCSFWNKVISPLGRAARIGAAALGVFTFGGGKQPDWYILQHEQIHFAIHELAARKLTRRLAAIPIAERDEAMAMRLYEITRRHAARRDAEFDAETSGTFDTFLIEKWTRLLERELEALCEAGQECGVRNYGGDGG